MNHRLENNRIEFGILLRVGQLSRDEGINLIGMQLFKRDQDVVVRKASLLPLNRVHIASHFAEDVSLSYELH